MEKWMPILTPIILFVLTVIIFPWVRQHLNRIKDKRLRDFAVTAIDRAEEIGRNHFKDNGGNKMDGSGKKAVAKNIIKELAGKAKIGLNDDEADILIEAALGVLALNKKR